MKIRGQIFRKLIVSTSVLACLVAAPATAQNAAASEEAATAEDSNTIIVTADRREQSLQDFAGTATVVSGEDLKKIGVQNFVDLQQSIPGLSVVNNGGNVEVFIRGIGSTNNTELGDPAAAFHFDGVSIPRPNGIGSAFYDIERVEVNVGPQGTLRGRNALAGSVNAITFKPGLGKFDGAIEAEYGNFDQRSATGVINVPLGDKVAVRFAGLYLQHDSYYKNVGPVTGIGVAEAEKNFSGRAQILFKPTDRLSILVAGDYIAENGTGYTGSNFALALGEIAAGRLQSLSQIRNPRNVIARGFTPIQNTDHWGVRTAITYEADPLTIEYTGSYRDSVYDYEAATPLTPFFPGVIDALSRRSAGASAADAAIFLGEALDNFSRFRSISDSRSHFHELRFFNNKGPFIWSLGAQYFREDIFSFLGSTGDRNPFFQGVEFNTNVDTDALATYGDFTYSVTNKFRVTGGVRYTTDRKERTGVAARYGLALGDDNFNCCLGVRTGTEGFEFAAGGRTIINPDTNGDGTISDAEVFQFQANGVARFGARDNLGAILAAGPVGGHFDDVPNGVPCLDTNFGDGLTCNGFAATTQFTFAVPFQGQIFRQQGLLNDQFVDWRLRAEYDITDDNLVYALVASGNKAGGFNDNLGDLGVAPTYDRESVVLYEVGSKNEFSIGRVKTRLNASLFYNDYSDQVFTGLQSVAQVLNFSNSQGASIALPPNTSTALVVSFSFNAAKSAIYGFQLQGGFDLPAKIKLDFSALYLEAKIKDSIRIQDSRFQADVDARNAILVDIDNLRLPRTPRWQLNAKLSQAIEIGDGQFDYVISGGYRSSQFQTIFNSFDFDDNGNQTTQVTSGRLLDRVPGHYNLDIGAGYTFDSAGKYRVEAFANNITNSVRAAAIIITQFDNTRFFNRPRTFGARVRAKF
jgi:iron complex outermembrane recepter protein